MNAPPLELQEAAALLRSMTTTEAQLFVAMAGTLALRHGDVAAGLLDALASAARDRSAGAAP